MLFVQEGAVTLCLYRMMLWALKTRVESETKLKMFSSSSTSMGTQWEGEDAFLLLDTRMSIMPLKCPFHFHRLDFHCTGTERWQMLIPQRLWAASLMACYSKPSVSLSKPRSCYQTWVRHTHFPLFFHSTSLQLFICTSVFLSNCLVILRPHSSERGVQRIVYTKLKIVI